MCRQFSISFGVNKQSCRCFIVIALLSRVCSMHELCLGSPCIVFSLPLGGFTRIVYVPRRVARRRRRRPDWVSDTDSVTLVTVTRSHSDTQWHSVTLRLTESQPQCQSLSVTVCQWLTVTHTHAHPGTATVSEHRNNRPGHGTLNPYPKTNLSPIPKTNLNPDPYTNPDPNLLTVTLTN